MIDWHVYETMSSGHNLGTIEIKPEPGKRHLPQLEAADCQCTFWINGILTYDRRVKKADAATLAEIHRKAGF